MKLLLDTHLLLRAVKSPERLTEMTQNLINDPEHKIYFSTLSISGK